MNTETRTPRTGQMDLDAYAGFLRLLFEPAGRTPRQAEHAAEVAAYLQYVADREPLSEEARRAVDQAA